MTEKEKETVTAIINDRFSHSKIATFPQESQIKITDTALSYYKYRLIAEQPSPPFELREKKNEILLARLGLPAQKESFFTPLPQLKSPAKGNRPMLTGSGVGYDSINHLYLKLHWSPFSEEVVGQNHLEGDELVVLDTTVGVSLNDHSIFVDNFDLIRIRELKKDFISIKDENPWSWQLRIGTSLTEKKRKYYTDGVVSFGAGRAWEINESTLFYAMTGTSAHTIQPYARLRPEVGLIIDNNSIKSSFYAGGENIKNSENFDFVYGGEIQYKIAENFALSFCALRESTTRTSAELKWYW